MVAPQFLNIQVKHTSILYSVFMCAVRNHSLTIWVIITITSCFAKITQVLEMLKCYRSWSRIYLAFHLQRGLQKEEEDFCERRPVSDSELGSLLLQILVVCADGHKLGQKSNHTIRTSSQFPNTEYLYVECAVLPCTGMWGQVYSMAQGYWSCSS